MIGGSFVLGVTLCCFAAWLHWNEKHGWPDETFVTELDNQYRAKRSRARGRIHAIIAACGVLSLVAAIAGEGAIWIAAWMSVMVGLIAVVFLAGIDALRTYRYSSRKLPEIRREVLGDDD